MAGDARADKALPPLNLDAPYQGGRKGRAGPGLVREEEGSMAFLAIAMFVALFAFGDRYMGWNDPQGQVQMALFMAFIFGIICGYRTGK